MLELGIRPSPAASLSLPPSGGRPSEGGGSGGDSSEGGSGPPPPLPPPPEKISDISPFKRKFSLTHQAPGFSTSVADGLPPKPDKCGCIRATARLAAGLALAATYLPEQSAVGNMLLLRLYSTLPLHLLPTASSLHPSQRQLPRKELPPSLCWAAPRSGSSLN